MAPVAPVNFPIGWTIIPDGAQAAVALADKNGNMRVNGQLTVGSISMIDGGTTGTLMDNNEFLSGLTSSSPAVVKRLIGLNSSNLVSIDPDLAGVTLTGGALTISSSVVNVGLVATDVNFTVQSVGNANHFVADAGLFSGKGGFGFGSAAVAGFYITEDAPALTNTGSALFARHAIANTNAMTVSNSPFLLAASLYVTEPNLTLASGTLDVAATVAIASAPTEGDANYSLYVAAGNSLFVGEIQSGAGGGRVNAVTAAYGVGTPYALTNSAAAIDFGTTDPAIVLPKAGTYMISGQVNLAYNAATVAAETATIKVRRTNNTAADLSDVVVLDLPAATTLTHTYGIFQIPPFIYTTAATDDAVTLFANVSAALGAGTIDATAIGTSITATRLY